MFSEYKDKKIPKDLKSCYKKDKLNSNLWKWCERLEVWGKVLFACILVFGLIFSVISSQITEEVTHGTYYTYTTTETYFDSELCFLSLLKTFGYAFLEYCSFHVVALIIGSLASIVQHTQITANIALYKAAKSEGVTDDFEMVEPKTNNDACNEEDESFESID